MRGARAVRRVAAGKPSYAALLWIALAASACAHSPRSAPEPERTPSPSSSPAPTAAASRQSAPARSEPGEAQASRPLSEFEARWHNACGDGGQVGALSPVLAQTRAMFDSSVSTPLVLSLQAKAGDAPAIRVTDGGLGLADQPPPDTAIGDKLEATAPALRRCMRRGSYRALLFPLPADGRAPTQFRGLRAPDDDRGVTTLGPLDSQARCAADLVFEALAGVDLAPRSHLVVVLEQASGAAPQGSLSKEHIRRVIGRDAVPGVRACYERALSVWPHLTGTSSVRFVILPDGGVGIAGTASSTLGHPELECCINTVVKALHFDPPRGGGIVVVTYPFLVIETAGEPTHATE